MTGLRNMKAPRSAFSALRKILYLLEKYKSVIEATFDTISSMKSSGQYYVIRVGDFAFGTAKTFTNFSATTNAIDTLGFRCTIPTSELSGDRR
jgi:hypothetical protein